MFFGFLIGALVGFSVGFYILLRNSRDSLLLDEEKQMLIQENQIVVEFMHNMVEAIGEGVDRHELFKRVVHAAILSTGALSACVFEFVDEGRKLRGSAVEGLFPPHRPLPESSRMKLTTRARFIEQILRNEEFPVGEGIVGSVARASHGMLIPEADNDPRLIRHEDPALRVHSLIVVPINFRETKIGVLAIVNPVDGVAFNETDLSLASSLAEQAALAIHNLDLMGMQIEKNKLDLDINLASNIQGMLLPKKFPSNDIVDINAIYQPAQKVGGDLYDVFQLDENRIGFAIADVSGKGIPASLVMAICQNNLRHFSKQYNSPAKVLVEMNRAMENEMRRDMFVTLIYAIIDTSDNSLTIARAGHELPALFHEETSKGTAHVEMIHSEGMALGMVPTELFEAVIQETTVPFLKGDILVLYTDGITETTNQSDVEFSNARLADTIRLLHTQAPKQMNEGLVEAVNRFAGDIGKHDDITLLTVKHK
jgi:sigma-B regulation protein RsbU (phosphoserine phosphatase)